MVQFKIVVLFGGIRMGTFCFTTIWRSFYIISLDNFLLRVENISHNHKIAFPNYLSISIFLNKFMKAEELSDKRLGILFYVIVIIF